MDWFAEFEWWVPRAGIQWLDAHRLPAGGGAIKISQKPERFLSPGTESGLRTYHPFRDAESLFRELGEVIPTEEGVLSFANKYGPLMCEEDIVILQRGHPVKSAGEQLDLWTSEIFHMKHALRVTDALQSESDDLLAEWFAVKDFGEYAEIRYRPDEKTDCPFQLFRGDMAADRRSLSFGHTKHQTTFDVVDFPTDPRGLALAFLQIVVELRLTTCAGLQFRPTSGHTQQVPLGLSPSPINLLGAIWIQFARSIQGDVRHQRCPQCQDWFQVKNKARRSTTTFCSTRCRMQNYRRRQAEARQLSKDGRQPEAIAEQLRTDVQTVKDWLKPVDSSTPSTSNQKRTTKDKGQS